MVDWIDLEGFFVFLVFGVYASEELGCKERIRMLFMVKFWEKKGYIHWWYGDKTKRSFIKAFLYDIRSRFENNRAKQSIFSKTQK